LVGGGEFKKLGIAGRGLRLERTREEGVRV
jgi:hypothetical protein